MPFQQPYTGFI